MDLKRINRYKDKNNLITERIGDIEEWIFNLDNSNFISDKKTRLAVYKAFQEITEASFDIVAMMCKDFKIIPKDDYTNIMELYNKKIIDESIKDALSESNGLRNRLVHHYNALDDNIAFEAIKELIQNFKIFTEVINKWLKSQV